MTSLTTLPPLWETPKHASSSDWSRRRAELVNRFAQTVYGVTPDGGELLKADVILDLELKEKRMRLREVLLTVTGSQGTRDIAALVHTPLDATDDVPVFIGLNFGGNHTTTIEPQVKVSPFAATDRNRGDDSGSWPYEQICSAGFAVITAFYQDVARDRPEGGGARDIFDNDESAGPKWGNVGTWAWGLSRLLDLAAQLPGLDGARAIAFGHSRLGKAALWAAAQDERFAGVVSNQSGCLGASLTRHHAGEDLAAISSSFGYWLTPGLAVYANRDDELPVDQHQLLAAIAPRAVLVSSAEEDFWCDPRGEYLATLLAAPAFRQFGLDVPPDSPYDELDLDDVPEPERDVLLGGPLAYHRRKGDHSTNAADWDIFCRFAGMNLPARDGGRP